MSTANSRLAVIRFAKGYLRQIQNEGASPRPSNQTGLARTIDDSNRLPFVQATYDSDTSDSDYIASSDTSFSSSESDAGTGDDSVNMLDLEEEEAGIECKILQTRSQTRKRAIENQGLTNNTKDPEKRQTSDLSYIRVGRLARDKPKALPTAEDIRRRNKENIRTVKKICKEGNFSIAEVHSLAFAITVDNLKAFKTLAKLFQVLTNIQSCDRIDDNGIHLLPEHYVEILEIRFSDAQEVAKEEAMLVKTAFEALRYRAIRIPVLIIQLHHFIPDDDILRTMMFVHRIGCDYLSISTTGDDEGNDDRPYARLTENDILSNELHPLVEDLRLSNATSLFCDKMASWTWALVLGSRLSNLELDNVRFLEGADDMSVFFSNFEAPFLYKLAITRCPVHSQDVVSFLWRHPTIKGLTISHLSSRRDSVPAMVHTGGILPNLVSLSGPARLLACLLDLSAPECSKNLTFLSILSEDGGTDTAGPRMDPTHILLVLERVVKFQTLEHIDLELTGLAGVSELSWLTEAYDVISSSELRRKVTSISKVSISTSKCDVHEREKSLGDLFSWLKVFPNINQIYVYDTAPRNRPVAHVLQSLIPNGWVVRLDICVEGVEARMFADEYVESHLPWLPGKTSPVDRCCCVTM